jgi:hypothetical protein
MRRIALASIALILASGCSDDPDPAGPSSGQTITLTASQAASLVARMESFGAGDPSIAALADTIDVVIKAGAEARRVDVTTDLGEGPYWAVSLQMFQGTTTTFHVVAFNDASNPTQFIILGGASLGSSSPVISMSGAIGTSGGESRTGHLYSVAGTEVSAWHASGGAVAFTAHPTSQACSNFPGPGSCVSSSMDATFSFTSTVPDQAATGQRTASGTLTALPGVRLSN